jgi:predicted ATP-dependent protease
VTGTQPRRIPPEKLRASFDPATLEFECTDELTPLSDFVGQERATSSLEFGLTLRKPGYNIFVTGMTGTGKATAILDYVRRHAAAAAGAASELRDWCYVFNFDDPDRPNALSLPRGTGHVFREHLEQLLNAIRGNISAVFVTEDYERQHRQIFGEGQSRGQALMEDAEHQAETSGFELNFLPTGPNIVPLKDGRPMTPDEFNALSIEERHAISERERPIGELVAQVGEKLQSIAREVAAAVQALDRSVIETIVRGPFDVLDQQYAGDPKVSDFLRRLREFTLKGADFLRRVATPDALPATDGSAPLPGAPDPFVAFRVNVFVDNSGTLGPPIIVEPNPSWTNLFGRIDRRAYMGTYLSDHTMLKPGTAHRANGGYLILTFSDLAARPGAWEGLKRMIRTREIRLEDPMEQYGLLTPQTLRPEPISADIKVLIAGDALAHNLLSAYDDEFGELFKVKADFDYEISRTPANASAYARFVCGVCESEKLRHFDRTGIARLIEHGSRVVEDQAKLSARFGRMGDLVIESDYWAGQTGSPRVTGEHVARAIDEKVYRGNLIEERVREMIARGTIMIDTGGKVVGQVNGLEVLSFGDVSFGRPARITARTYLGQRGIVSIDRESQLSGKIHDKGVLILSGYLGWQYGRQRPLSLSATISFEQGYDPVDGDSASLGETCAILSALADVPIRQDLAITGSVNQKGEVQPIGGINVKVEGFHDVCRAIEFTGTQGVVVPARNIQNLMLRPDVVESVRESRFHVYEVTSVDEALELLTGLPAGVLSTDGAYPEGSIHYLVDKKLDEMAEAMQQSGRTAERTVVETKPNEPPAKEPRKPPRLPN